MELSCKTEYALLALLTLADGYPQQGPRQIRQIAAQQHLPDRYLEQLLATLRRAGFVQSQRGVKGGYVLAKSPLHISLWDVVNCIDGPDASRLGSPPRTLEGLIVREIWQEVLTNAQAVWQGYTLQDLCDHKNERRQLEHMYYI
ncbi:MAG: Rrf2 family transcriptional regulator [Cyanobacteria bacterium P01_H01_bin.15]